MSDGRYRRLRGLAFLGTAVLATVLLAFFATAPRATQEMHPWPLLALLAVTLVVAIWQAAALLQ
jgi:hypothetical protein